MSLCSTGKGVLEMKGTPVVASFGETQSIRQENGCPDHSL